MSSASSPIEQLHANLLLERMNMLTHRRLA
jgi:hypothetical protein